MNWNCEQIEERLADYTDRLLGPAERESFAAHLAGCRRCDALERRVASMTLAIHALEPLEPPARLVYAILDETSKKEKASAPGWLGWLRWLGPLGQPRFAMGTVTMAALLLVTTWGAEIQWSQLTWSDLKPTNLYQSLDRRANLMYARSVKFVNELRVVYAIENMLQPASGTQGESQPDNKGSEKKDQPGQKTNRARDFQPVIPVSLAAITETMDASALVSGLPGRSN